MDDPDELESRWYDELSALMMAATNLGLMVMHRDERDLERTPRIRAAAAKLPDDALIEHLKNAAAMLFATEKLCHEAGVDLINLGFNAADRSLMDLRRAARAAANGRWVTIALDYMKQRNKEIADYEADDDEDEEDEAGV